jgi:hypothetical protein
MLPTWRNCRANGLARTVTGWTLLSSICPELRKTEEASISHATSGERDAVIRAGNENADLVTPANIAVKKSLDELADSLVTLLENNKADLHAKNQSLNLGHSSDHFRGPGPSEFSLPFS